MPTTVNQARDRITAFARNAGDSTSYSKLMVDLAISGILGDFIRYTRCTDSVDSVDLSQDNPLIDFSAIIGFQRARVVDISVDSAAWATAHLTAGVVTSITVNKSLPYSSAPDVTFSGGEGSGATATAVLTLGHVTSFTVSAGGSGYTSAPTVLLNGSSVNYPACEVAPGVEIVGPSDIRTLQRESGSGTPTYLGFLTTTSARVWKPPSADGTMTVVWNPLLVTWSYGDPSITTALNIPDDHIQRVLQTGGPAALQISDPEHDYKGAAFALYRNYRDSMSGADGNGAKSIIRNSREDYIPTPRLISGNHWW